MPSDWPDNSDSVLRGLFGSFTSAAGQRLTTAGVWDALRTGASNWASSVLAVTSAVPPSAEEISAKASQLLGHVTIIDVNNWRHVAGQQVRAQNNLMAQGLGEQITAGSIFTPPWARTAANPAIATSYRMTVQYIVEPNAAPGTSILEPHSYSLGTVLTTPGDALSEAQSLLGGQSYTNTGRITGISSYSIEAI